MTTYRLTRLAWSCLLGAIVIVLVLAGDFIRGQLERQESRAVPALPADVSLVDAPARPTSVPAPAGIAPPTAAVVSPTISLRPTVTPEPIGTTPTVVLTPTATPGADLPALSAMRIPAIDLARTIVPALFDATAGWDVPKYQAGHHDGSAQPGDGTNIVLNGHVGGSDPVFDRLIDLATGDTIILYRGNTPFVYHVTEWTRIQVVGADPAAVAAEAARWLAPTSSEAVTLITCWPPSGPNAYDQRLIIRATP
jgi:sortase A